MNKLNELISDGDGSPSTMRVAVLLVVAPIMFVWAYLCIKAGQMIPLPWSQLSVIGVALGSKAMQSFAERGLSADNPDKKALSLKPTAGASVLMALGLSGFLVLTGCTTQAPAAHSGAIPKPGVTNLQSTVTTSQVNWDIVANTICTLAAGGAIAAEMYDTNSVPYLRMADQVLTVALADKAYDPAALKTALSNSSANELQEGAAQAAILAAIAIYDANWQRAVASKIDANPVAEKLLTALRDGIEAGIGCAPAQ